jgi:RHS repeat-associated protein
VAAALSADETSVTNALRYDAWGEITTTGSGGGSAVGTGLFEYQGRLDVAPAGLDPLYDMSARFYSPELGVFTSLDSVMGSAQNPLSMNRFLYAHANPATLIDPTGHAACIRFIDGVCQGYHSQVKRGTVKAGTSGMSPAWQAYYKRKQQEGRTAEAQVTRRQVRYGTLTNREIKVVKEERARELREQAYDRQEQNRMAAVSKTYLAMPETPRDEGIGGFVHGALDVVGMVPVIGTGADLVNAGIYAVEGDYLNAAMSGISAIPVAGDIIGGGRLAVKYGDDVVGAVAHLGDDVGSGGLKLLDDAPAPGTFCSFTPDTPVATPDGDRPIGELRVGDEVVARDEATGETSVRRIAAVLRHDDPITGTVTIDGEVIRTTPEHPFFTLDRGFVPAADLRTGELVATATGVPGAVTSVRWDGGPAEMWNLTVEVEHTFFVGDRGWWVHNECTISKVAPDWETKGAHVHADGVELAVRPGQDASIVFKPVFSQRTPLAFVPRRRPPRARWPTRGSARS